jgi:predicted O-linked N-acetylglucosamine transferase (SPINDLY family)
MTDARLQQALALHRGRKLEDAERLYREILAEEPRHFDALHLVGLVQYEAGRWDAAVASIRAAIAVRPGFAPAFANLGLALQKLQRLDEALASYDRALALAPDYAEGHYNRGNVLLDLKRLEDAVASFDRALALEAGRAPALYNRGIALLDLERPEEAVASFDRALALKPEYAQALYNRAIALQHLRRQDEVAASLARLLQLVPDFPFAPGMLLHAQMHCCDWSKFGPAVDAINRGVRARKRVAEPFGYLGISDSADEQRICAEVFAAVRAPIAPAPMWNGETWGNAKIRIGYVSGEFRHQATSVLIGELFELHDRGRFELIAFDNGGDDASVLRGRIERAFSEIVSIARLGDREAAMAIRDRKIDLLINLNGYFGRERQRVFSFRPCPIQVSYLGFPGTLGAPYIDYILADPQVIPESHHAFYTEKVVRLPDTYQVNDRKRVIAQRVPTRAELGLPAAGFVFCCFNNNYKITPRTFDIWMRLLSGVPGSVLWLLEGNAAAVRNLRQEAQRRGVNPERLVFAPRMNLPEHLARHRQADLFVDTLPCNAHTTASDALWAGLPLLTCTGGTFAGRVGASLLHAAGLPELVTDSLDAYEARARELATAAGELAAIRARLERNRSTCPLFDTERFRRHIESAYITMWERWQRGMPPASFAVAPLP